MKSIYLTLSLSLFASSPAFAAECQASAEKKMAKSSIVETAVAAGSFNTLATALKTADLVGALEGPGPFTVFAPTDDAFRKLPEGTVATLLKPENRDQLKAILTYHVVAGSYPARKVLESGSLTSLNGQRIDFSVRDDNAFADGAGIVKTDIECSNGIIHVIDTVILPADRNIVETASDARTFRTLIAAAKAAGLAETLMGEGPYTVFAPTDEAFAALPAGTVESLLEPENKGKLVGILKMHVTNGRVYADQVVRSGEAMALSGDSLKVVAGRDGKVTINGSEVVKTDIEASNGVIHVINEVILN